MITCAPIPTYRLDRIKATPYPNRLLDLSITLPETQARIVNLIVRNSLGWYGGRPGTRKAVAYFTPRQLRDGVGRTTSAPVLEALRELVAHGIVETVVATGQATPLSPGQPLRLQIARKWVEEPGHEQ